MTINNPSTSQLSESDLEILKLKAQIIQLESKINTLGHQLTAYAIKYAELSQSREFRQNNFDSR